MPARPFNVLLASTLALGLLPLACDDDDGDSGGDTASSDTAADEHGADEHGADEHGDHDHSADESGGGTPAEDYCACVFSACHEPYHAKWGEDEIASREACIAEAEALPVNGGPVEMGNFLECRQHFCDAAATDASVCPNALGDAVCM